MHNRKGPDSDQCLGGVADSGESRGGREVEKGKQHKIQAQPVGPDASINAHISGAVRPEAPGWHKCSGMALYEPRPPPKEGAWNDELVMTLPFSTAVLSSDACHVLQHSFGAEPEAAQLLWTVLHPSTLSGPPGVSPPSVLSRLLGPKLEAEALQTLALGGRPWKGTIAVSTQPPKDSTSAFEEAQPVGSNTDPPDAVTRPPPTLGPPSETTYLQMQTTPSEHCPMDGPVRLESRFATCPAMIVVGNEEDRASGSRSTAGLSGSQNAAQNDRKRGPPRKNKSFNTNMRRASFLRMPEDAVDKLLSGSPDGDCSRTRSLLKGICQARTPEKARSASPRAFNSASQSFFEEALTHKLEAARSLSGAPSEGPRAPEPMSKLFSTGTDTLEDSEVPNGSNEMEQASRDFLGAHGRNDQAALPRATGFCADSAACWASQAPQTNSFDIYISQLKVTYKTLEPPLLLSIYNSSEHGQARNVLSSLAESQLELLSDIMPEHALQFLAMERREAIPANIGKLAHSHKDATILFMDLCGFTAFSKSVEAVQVMVLLNNLFSVFDRLTDELRVHKLETAGDCYIVCGGIMAPGPSPNGFATVLEEQQDPREAAQRVMDFAVRALQVASKIKLPGSGCPVSLRVGIHTGDCVSGLIGTKIPKFSCFGDAMNVASRMETTGVPGHVHISEATYTLLQHGPWAWEPTGGVEVKGKGRMSTFLWSPPSASPGSQMPPQVVDPQPSPSQYHHIQSACSLLQHVLSPVNSNPLPSIGSQAFRAHGQEAEGPQGVQGIVL